MFGLWIWELAYETANGDHKKRRRLLEIGLIAREPTSLELDLWHDI